MILQNNRILHISLAALFFLTACGGDELPTSTDTSLGTTELSDTQTDADLTALEEALTSFESHFSETGAVLPGDVSDVLPDDVSLPETDAEPPESEAPESGDTVSPEEETPSDDAIPELPETDGGLPDLPGGGLDMPDGGFDSPDSAPEEPSKIKALWDGFKQTVGGLIGRLTAPKEGDVEVPDVNPSDDPNAYPKRPVIFVPGFMEADPSFFFFGMRNHLKKQGWTDVYYLKNGFVVGAAEKYAERVKAKVDEVLAETGAEKVDIVAHSFGGLYTRYYLKNLGGTEKVEHFISISSPHQGTKTTKLGPVFPSAKQMMPNSSFLSQLNFGDPSPGNVCYATLRTNTDIIIQPYDSSILEGANNHFVRNKNHFTILFSKETYQIIQDTLSNPCDCCRAHG